MIVNKDYTIIVHTKEKESPDIFNKNDGWEYTFNDFGLVLNNGFENPHIYYPPEQIEFVEFREKYTFEKR